MDKSVLKGTKLFLLDMDGTVYIAANPIEGAFEAVQHIKDSGAAICYLTNNSSIPALQYITKLARGYGQTITADEIYSSTTATIEYLQSQYAGKRVYMVATSAVRQEFADAGVCVVDDEPDVVVLTFDKELDYDKLTRACNYLSDGAVYIATHPDMVCPFLPHDLPDIGGFMLLIEATCGRRPDVICGKPYAVMAQCIERRFGLRADQIAMVGDRLYTDIRFGIDNGFRSVLVLSGETDRDMLAESGLQPTLVLDSLRDIEAYL